MPNCFCFVVTYITSFCGNDDIRLHIINRKFINCRSSTFLSPFSYTTCWIIIGCTIGNAIIITICICCTGCGWSTYRVGDKKVISNIDLFSLILDVEVPRTLCEVIWWPLKTRRYCLIVPIENVICWNLLIEQYNKDGYNRTNNLSSKIWMTWLLPRPIFKRIPKNPNSANNGNIGYSFFWWR